LIEMRTVFSILLLAAMLCGCSSGGSTTSSGAAEGVELTYHRGGGLPGIDETLRIHGSGSATLVWGNFPIGEGEKSASRFRLSAAQAERLRTALEESGFDELELETPSSACVDCLLYELATPANQTRFDQVTVPLGLEPVLAQLDAIVAAHRPAPTHDF
jgi:hypothetical protein